MGHCSATLLATEEVVVVEVWSVWHCVMMVAAAGTGTAVASV